MRTRACALTSDKVCTEAFNLEDAVKISALNRCKHISNKIAKQCGFVVKLKECFVDYETSPNFLSAWEGNLGEHLL